MAQSTLKSLFAALLIVFFIWGDLALGAGLQREASSGGPFRSCFTRPVETSTTDPLQENLPQNATASALNVYVAQLPDHVEGQPYPVFSATEPAKTRSPILAGMMSAILPGAGEFYAESYWQSALFFALEVFAWQQYLSKTDDGHRAEREFVRFANADQAAGFDQFDGGTAWDARRYAQNLSAIYKDDPTLGDAAKALAFPATLQEIGKGNYTTLNDFERQATFENGSTFSHTLPGFGEQQYYELIGKYATYTIGWYDFPESELSRSFTYKSAAFRRYATMRGQANALLKEASTVLSLIVVNHALSIADAIWSTARYNDRVKTRLRLRRDPMLGVVYPEARLSVGF